MLSEGIKQTSLRTESKLLFIAAQAIAEVSLNRLLKYLAQRSACELISDPTLIIEVLSPSTPGYDKRDKFILYRSMTSLREYALIDPSKRQVEVFTSEDGGTWTLTDQTTVDVLTLASIDCRLPMNLVFKGVESEAAL